MKSNAGDMYILQDGTYADAGSCKKGDDGVVRHEGGLAVLVDSEGKPLTVQRQADEGGAARAAEVGRRAQDEPVRDVNTQAQPEAAEHKQAEDRKENSLSQAMMPEHTAKPDRKTGVPKGE